MSALPANYLDEVDELESADDVDSNLRFVGIVRERFSLNEAFVAIT